MNRRKKASGLALLVGGLLLALPALAVEKTAEQCVLDCEGKANAQVSTCAQACPTADPNKKEAASKCMSKCAERYHSTKSACASNCPKSAPEPQKQGGT